MVCKPNSVCPTALAAGEAAIYLSDLPIAQSRRSGTRSGQQLSIPEGMDCATYAVLHQAGFVVSRPSSTAGIPCGTIIIADDAVVSYTTFSPFLADLAITGMCFFCDTFRSRGYGPQNPRLTRGALPCGVRTFLPASVKTGAERLPDEVSSASAVTTLFAQKGD